MLISQTLYYFDDSNELNVLKGSIDCNSVTAITTETSKGESFYRISFGPGGKEHWDIKFVEDEPTEIHAMWMRKISRSCKRIPGGADVFKQLGANAAAVPAAAAPVAVSAGKKGKRTSVFG